MTNGPERPATTGHDKAPPSTTVPPQRIAQAIHRVFAWSGWASVASIATTIAALTALWFSGQSLRATDNQYALSQQTAVTDRFQKAVEQLTTDKLDARLAAIYLLERLAKDSPPDHPTIYSVLASFVRSQSPVWQCRTVGPPGKPGRLDFDVQTAVTVIGRRDARNDRFDIPIDLSDTCLTGLQLRGRPHSTGVDLPNLRRVNLTGANLTGATLFADLTGATLNRANLNGAFLASAKLAQVDGLDGTGDSVYYDEQTRWPTGFMPPPPIPVP
ncbi:pentapeptide repeat-containing protein [Nocardia mexicana]|uniref:Pentapeptide repeat protein n=1 Tax=Nocardia mexicana TaxID=279262 RepID=A0A370GYH8_9NOCA|nr:pentapeptide repeat-containing protein [Nocardia mexicana]RDI48549.1 pentapeptide repeat protein [Nocardia mexicana]